jgi:hypothetical protein
LVLQLSPLSPIISQPMLTVYVVHLTLCVCVTLTSCHHSHHSNWLPCKVQQRYCLLVISFMLWWQLPGPRSH